MMKIQNGEFVNGEYTGSTYTMSEQEENIFYYALKNLKGFFSLSEEDSKVLNSMIHDVTNYDDSGLISEQVTAEMQSENTKLKKAFTLACRYLADNLDCPAVDEDADFVECNGEMDNCGDGELWECWQRYFTEKIENEAVCRVCGCTQYNACAGGCSWVEEDLCSACYTE